MLHSILLSFFFLNPLLFSDDRLSVSPPPPPSPPFGLIIHYSKKISAAELNRIHTALNYQVKEHFPKWNADWVIPKNGSPYLSERAFLRACERYRKQREGIRCEANRRLIPSEPNFEHEGLKNRKIDNSSRGCKEVLNFEEHGQSPLLQGGTLTRFWAQSQIGADLVPELLSDLKDVSPINVGVFDSGFVTENVKSALTPKLSKEVQAHPEKFVDPKPHIGDAAPDHKAPHAYHGDLVANLISSKHSPFPVGSGHLVQISELSPTLYESDVAKIPISGVKIANFSLGWGNLPKRSDGTRKLSDSGTFAMKVFKALEKEGTIVVKSAGNDYPDPIAEISKNSRAILVGSSSPEGMASSFSQEGEEVTILAPSDKHVQSLGPKDSLLSFGGTSGAAPLVSGALGDAAALLPGLTTQEAKALLKYSAIPSYNSKTKPQLNGAGILNQYRLVAAAKKIRMHWPANREKIFQPESYDFSKKAKELKENGLALLPQLDCKSQTEAILFLRKSFFLDPSDETVIRALAKFYRDYRRPKNAEFFDNLLITPEAFASQIKEKVIDPKNPEAYSTLYKARRNLMGKEANQLYQEVVKKNPRLNELAFKAIAEQGDLETLKPYLFSDNKEEKLDALFALQHLKQEPPLELLQKLESVQDMDSLVGVMRAAQKLEARGLPIFLSLFEKLNSSPKNSRSDSSKSDKMERLLMGSWSLADKRIDFLTEVAKKDPNSLLKTLSKLEMMEPEDYVTLFNQLMEHKDPRIRSDISFIYRGLLSNLHKDPEALKNMVRAVEKWLTLIEPNERYRFISFLSYLGKEGEKSIATLFEKGDGSMRAQMMRALPYGSNKTEDPYEKMAFRILTENSDDPEAIAEALAHLRETHPKKALEYLNHDNVQVQEAIFDIFRQNPEFTNSAETKAFIKKTAQQKLPEAAFQLGRSPDESMQKFGFDNFKDFTPKQKRLFLIGAMRNSKILDRAIKAGLDSEDGREETVDVTLFGMDRTDEDHKTIAPILTETLKNPTYHKLFFDTLFKTPNAHKRFRRADESFLKEVAKAWEERKFPKIEEELHNIFEYSDDPDVKAIFKKSKK